ncbi:efflux RND transporter periplasmic adaptor subunit [Epibacterium ulvae]|uniref:efflux RND transporter periplasmic adaptor subunit n=1 Tax=Epibacterium ulvae TaxID=1156985 RepID=UPI0024927F9C|nr:efflux RND transporter periplasmic adaptor subunit [Epibacterium ulvae]
MKSFCSMLGLVIASMVFPTASSAQEQTIRPAKVVDIRASDTMVSRRYPASVLPSREIELTFKVPGQVIDLPVRAATNVKTGDVIAQIDKRDYENQLATLQSQRDQASAELDALKAGARAEEIIALEAAVEAAQAQVDQAREALVRAETLLERGVATRVQLEGAQAESRVAEANLRAQQEQLRIGKSGGRPEEIAAAEAVIRGIDAQIKAAQDALSDTILVAPFDGIIARRDIENFSNVQAGQSIVLLQGLDVVHLAFDIPGPDVTQLTRNGPDTISNMAFFDALPGQEFEAEIVEFSVQADSATQTYRGRVAVVVPENAVILPGMVASVVASTEGAGAQVFAPLSSIASKPNGDPFVWVVNGDGLVSEQTVKLGEASGADVVITDGLSAGDVVIAAGVSQIVDGTTVRPIRQVGN